MKYDWMIVGAGIYGATCAQRLAESGQSVLVLDRRPHLAGNCFTKERHKIQCHEYGPHIFHTNSQLVWDYVNQFTQFNSFVNRVKALSNGRLYSLPINLSTLYALWGTKTPAEARDRLKRDLLDIKNPQNLEEWALANIGVKLYTTLIYGYTKKQWGREPRELPATIIKRLPIRFTFDDNYYSATYQGIPLQGYTDMVTRMLDHPKIEVHTGVSFDPNSWRNHAHRLIYTGAPDELLEYKYGELEYRSLGFTHHRYSTCDLQGNAIINYCDTSISYTRTIEHGHFLGNKEKSTIVTKEYPQEWSRGMEAFYPIMSKKNVTLHRKYKEEIESNKDIILGGRLGDYRYYDMDQAIGSALLATAQFTNLLPRVSK
jgi:UDP-galactopyranose mutase